MRPDQSQETIAPFQAIIRLPTVLYTGEVETLGLKHLNVFVSFFFLPLRNLPSLN